MPPDVIYLVSLLIVPGLLGLMLLMETLEEHFAGRMVADELALLMGTTDSPEDLEEQIARAAQPLFTRVRS